MGLGLGLTFMPLTMLATYGSNTEDAGLASGLLNASQQVGGSLGLAILSTLAASQASGYISGLGHLPGAIDQASAQVAGYRAAFWASGALMVIGAGLLAVLIRSDEARVDNVAIPLHPGIDV